MNETSINATVQTGGVAAVAGAAYVHIENLTQYAAPPTAAPAQVIGPIPLSPYPGLAYFGPEQANVFFGREQAIQALVAAVAKRGFTVLVGASGSGKSSVVLAGLAPRLDMQGGWRSSYFRVGTEPDKNPFSALARALEPLTGDRGLTDQLKEVQKLAEGLAEGSIKLTNVLAACRTANTGKRILLIADQFEELFTLVSDEMLRNRFIDTLIEAFPDPTLGATPDVSLVLTLRADFVSQAVSYRQLADQLKDRVEYLGPMTREELRDAIAEPAKAVGAEFEPGLVNTILNDVEKRPGSLPLLQFALREMWGQLKTLLMTRADYDAIGGVEGALAKRAQAIFDDVTHYGNDETKVALFRRLFTRLVTLGEGAEDTRRIVGREELGPDTWALAQRLAGEDNRLVVTAGSTPGKETAEVVHEALIRGWPTLVDWVNGDREFLSWLGQLKPRGDEWCKTPEDEGMLLRGGPLAVAEDWVGTRGDDLSEKEKSFIVASIALRRHLEERQKARLRLGILAISAFGFLVAVGAIAVWRQYNRNVELQASLTTAKTSLSDSTRAVGRQQEALKEAWDKDRRKQIELDAEKVRLQHQQANLLGELATVQLSRGNLDAALRFSSKGTEDDLALPLKLDTASTSIAALEAALSKSDWRLAFMAGKSILFSASFSPDGSRIVTASLDGTARIWDAKIGREIAVLRGHESWVTYAAFSADGLQIITASRDKTARVWNATTEKEIAVLRGHEDTVASAAFSPDGSRIVTASIDGTARIWDAAASKEIAVLRGHVGAIFFAEFSPDGKRIVTASVDGTARIWDATTSKEIAVLRGHEGPVNSAEFSPDGTRIVTASFDNTARVWDAATSKEIAVLRGHKGPINCARFSPDGLYIVAASDDNTGSIWDTATAKEIARLPGHAGPVTSATFSPDGSRIVTASNDGTARIWDAKIGREIAVLRGHENWVTFAAFSPEGSRIVTASNDRTARVWDAKTAGQIAVLRGHEGPVNSATFSRDGSRIVTASNDGTARIWDPATAMEVVVLRGHESWVTSAAFSPDGSRVLTASYDRTARLWDAASGKEVGVLRGEYPLSSAAFSPDGSRIVTASNDGTARIWDVSTAKEIAVLRGHAGPVTSAAFSPDGSRIVTASQDKTARIWDVATAEEIAVLRGHDSWVTSAKFSPAGSSIITTSQDNTVRVWDAATAVEITVLRGHEGGVTSAAFSPDGSRVVTASEDATARVWGVHFATMGPKELLAEVCQRRLIGFSTMTREEMRLSDFPDSEPLIDVCAGIAEARP